MATPRAKRWLVRARMGVWMCVLAWALMACGAAPAPGPIATLAAPVQTSPHTAGLAATFPR